MSAPPGSPAWPPGAPVVPQSPPERWPVPPDLRIVAEGLRFPEGPIAYADGSVLVVEVRGEALTRVHPDGRPEVVAAVPGGPNGAAVGPDGAVYVCNNGGLPWTQLGDGSWYPIDPVSGSMTPPDYRGGSVDRVDLGTGAVDRLLALDGEGRPLSAPNDIVFDADGRLWFTDTGKTDDRRTTLGAVHRAAADGSRIETVAFGLLGPNGIGLSPDGHTLYVADTPSGRIWRWDLADGRFPTGTPRQHGGTVVSRLPGAVALDSLAVDAEGRIVVALPGAGALAVVQPDGGLWLLEVPDPMPTNICFGGPGGQTAFVTLGGCGLLAAFRWPCAGVPLAFTA